MSVIGRFSISVGGLTIMLFVKLGLHCEVNTKKLSLRYICVTLKLKEVVLVGVFGTDKLTEIDTAGGLNKYFKTLES